MHLISASTVLEQGVSINPNPRVSYIYNKLYRERTLFLGEEIDDELANQLVGIMRYINKNI